MMKNRLAAVAMLLTCAASAAAAPVPVKVRILPDDARQAYAMRHWQSWNRKGGDRATFEGVTAALSAEGGQLSGPSVKSLIEDGMHLGTGGVTAGSGGTLMLTLRGLPSGRHTLATFHHEPREKEAETDYQIAVNGKTAVAKFSPTRGVAADEDVGATYLTLDVQAGQPVEVTFKPLSAGGSVILDGFEIDGVDPHQKAIKPTPEDNDEHVAEGQALTWSAHTRAAASLLYLGTSRDAVENATEKSPEFKGRLTESKFTPSGLDHQHTYFWRVDEVAANGEPVKGDVWSFRPRFLAFPTAEGYGRFAIGGRGGRVIEVTNLEDYAAGQPPIPGSYRAAVEAEGPRTVVFRVSGVIFLKRECGIRNPYITVAGQTAPGDGICLANFSAGMSTHDAIVRYVRVRVGDFAHKAMDGMGLGNSDDSIIDHCSISWAMDEGTSSRGGHNITFQWNIISEMLQHGYHYNAGNREKYETHAFAGSISGDIGSYHHNLLAHCTDRNWSLAGGLDQAGKYAGLLDIRNNVVYNWTARTTDGGVKDLDYVNNYYKPYPKQTDAVKWLLRLDPINDAWGKERVYMSGNVMEGFNYDKDNWAAFDQNRGERRTRDQIIKLVRVDEPLFPSYVKEESARDAYQRVIAGAGATLPKRDVIDRRIAEEVRTGTVHYMGTKAAEWAKDPGNKNNPNFPGIIDSQTDVHDADDSPVKPWPNYKTYNVPVDSDHDGMPDDWEVAHSLNPKDATDANGDYNHDGYTNLEKYLNSLTGEYKADRVARAD